MILGVAQLYIDFQSIIKYTKFHAPRILIVRKTLLLFVYIVVSDTQIFIHSHRPFVYPANYTHSTLINVEFYALTNEFGQNLKNGVCFCF